ncbi:apicoplast pyruvate carrier 1-like [Brevipalpus obovatus]|uniref:apicoplast pyruvate carrier 1-like n=1 Tax=Brevipalpus obovatus TaxID=246614 RepID=UPI003D9E73F0
MTRVKGLFAVLGTSIIYFSIGLYFSSGNTAIYLTSYLRQITGSSATLSDSVWFLYAVGLSALILPLGGWLDSKIGSRAVCLIGGLLQSGGILGTYFALEHSFLLVLICYGGSFFLSCGVAYTAPLVEINKWFPERKGLVTGIACASMAFAPTAWTPMITAFVNPLNIPPDMNGYFTDINVLHRTRQCLIIQGIVTLGLFIIGVIFLFPAPSAGELEEKRSTSASTESIRPCHYRIESGLEPKKVIRTKEFIILSIKIMFTELVFFYLLFVYKPFGATFIKNDLLLSTIGACAAISNTLFRLFMGYIKDMFSYKALCIPLSAISTILIFALPYTSMMDPIVYAVCAVTVIGLTGSQYALMPSAVTDTFGEKYASMNMGLVYMSTVIADVGGALGSQYLTKSIGWEGMIYTTGFFAFLDFVATFSLPNDAEKELNIRIERSRAEKFYKINKEEFIASFLRRTPPPPYNSNRNIKPKLNSNFDLFNSDFRRYSMRW